MAKFNLIDEPWIPVREAGQVRLVGIGEVLLRAEEIEAIEVASPLEEAVLHRLLLAVLHRALAGPADLDAALQIYERDRFPRDKLEAYLDRHHDRFFLFDGAAPFLQIADLPEENPIPWTKLIPERASGNNPTLFDHTTDDQPPLASYAEAARALLVHEAFQPGGLIQRLGVNSGKAGPLSAAAVFVLQGTTLFETLTLNLVPYEPDGDAAIWEIEPVRASQVAGSSLRWPLSGTARVYTWISRGTKLLDDGNGVLWLGYGPGIEPLPSRFLDSLVAYTVDREGEPQPVRLSLAKSFWRDFAALLPSADGRTPPRVLESGPGMIWEATRSTHVPLRVLGQVSNQAKILDVRREVYPFPKDAWDARCVLDIQSALRIAEDVGQILTSAAKRVARSALNRDDRQAVQKLATSFHLLPLYWSSLDRAFISFLNELGGGTALDKWREEVRRVAVRAWETTRAAIGTGARHLKAVQEGEREVARVKEVVTA